MILKQECFCSDYYILSSNNNRSIIHDRRRLLRLRRIYIPQHPSILAVVVVLIVLLAPQVSSFPSRISRPVSMRNIIICPSNTGSHYYTHFGGNTVSSLLLGTQFTPATTARPQHVSRLSRPSQCRVHSVLSSAFVVPAESSLHTSVPLLQ